MQNQEVWSNFNKQSMLNIHLQQLVKEFVKNVICYQDAESLFDGLFSEGGLLGFNPADLIKYSLEAGN